MDPHTPTWRRRIVMALILLIAAALFTATKFASNAWIHKRQQLARQWVRNGDREGLESRPREAVVSYRNALLYDDDSAVRFRMSRAMIAAGDTSEAEAYLLSLLADEPGNANYNLALARLSERQNASDKSIGYYRAALLGRWQSDPIQQRLETNLELVRLLLKNQRYTDARATLLSLTAEMPPDTATATQIEIAHLFFAAGGHNEAAAIAQQVLHQNPEDGALRAFYAGLLLHSGEFKRARQQFQLASEHTNLTADMQAQFDIAQQADTLDPYARGLRIKEQSTRLKSILSRVQQRLSGCSPNSQAIPQTKQWMRAANLNNLRAHREAADQIVNFAVATEQSMAACPLRVPADSAIQLIGKQQ